MAQPDLIPMPFAENATPGTIEPIPATTPTVPQDATWSAGFPQVTMQPLAAGGIPPRGQNFNGVLNALSQHIFHMQGGGQYKWDAAHGPYSIGDVLQSDDGLRSYVSAINNNTDNFNTTPGVIGTSWLPWSGGTATELIAGLMKIATTAQAQSGTNDANSMSPAKTAALFPFRGIQVFDIAGTYTWTVPDGVTKAWVHVTAGGGGGGYHGSPGRGGGGGAGGTAIKLVDLTGVSSVSVTVGAGGAAGGFSVNGGNGGTSSFGEFASATGGQGGSSQGSSTPIPAGGFGGTATGGDINIRGGAGSDGHTDASLNELTAGGAGGAGFYGGNGKGGSPSGEPGFNGGGGGGAGSAGAPNTATGGDGIVTIQW